MFDFPGRLDDLDATERALWSSWVNAAFEGAKAGRPHKFRNDAPRRQFFNPLTTNQQEQMARAPIEWPAFPRQQRQANRVDSDRWEAADSSRQLQDEYCEWSVRRNEAGKITAVTFTSEPPEYWQFLAGRNPNKVVALYQKYISPEVKKADLFDGDRYNPENDWNNTTTAGAMHLMQESNTLGAEIELAAAATITRRIDGRLLEEEQELIECSRYGEKNRSSDPHIGGEVNRLARKKAEISLEDPVGLYIDRLETTGWITPDDADPGSFWTTLRGVEGHHVRAIYEVPQERGYTVSDITILGEPIMFGARIADFITVRLTGISCREGKSDVPPQSACRIRAATGLPGIAPDEVETGGIQLRVR